MKPYYDEAGITIYHGDCREVLPYLERVDSVVTDPVWPNAKTTLAGAGRATELFAEMASLLPTKCDRLVVQLGCDSDPRFLLGVPPSFRFFRVCWLEYACPTPKGRILYTGDAAYAFGIPPKSAPGRRVIPGRYISTKADALRIAVTKHKEFGKASPDHPAPRRYQHVRGLVSRFVEQIVLDPFCGSGTTLVAAKNLGYHAIGIEIEERFCDLTVKRLGQSVMQFGAKAG